MALKKISLGAFNDDNQGRVATCTDIRRLNRDECIPPLGNEIARIHVIIRFSFFFSPRWQFSHGGRERTTLGWPLTSANEIVLHTGEIEEDSPPFLGSV